MEALVIIAAVTGILSLCGNILLLLYLTVSQERFSVRVRGELQTLFDERDSQIRAIAQQDVIDIVQTMMDSAPAAPKSSGAGLSQFSFKNI